MHYAITTNLSCYLDYVKSSYAPIIIFDINPEQKCFEYSLNQSH